MGGKGRGRVGGSSGGTGRPKAHKRRAEEPKGFVGRDGSPVLDRYPPKDPSLAPRGPTPLPASDKPPRASPQAATAGSALPMAPSGGSAPPIPLVTLERPFDVEEFSRLLGETTLKVEVPREELSEVLRRVAEFMGFGIYVYSFRVRPSPSDQLTKFVVELQRVDFSAERGDWLPFEEKGRSDSPFGPSGGRR